ncbi:MAG: alpha/beta hydrolase-fold protein [Winogradskyella sp.]
MKLKKIVTIFITIVSINALFSQVNLKKDKEFEKKNLELPKVEVVPLIDTNTNRHYELYIKLPEGYSEDNKTKYPVLYFTDALWHIELLSGASEYLMKDLILVGISWQKDENPAISRYRDYTLLKDMNPKYQSGDAENHLRFIQNEVFEYVENHFKAQSENRSYFGYSLGATFGTYVLFSQPETFTNYILGSPETLLDETYIYKHKSISTQNLKSANANIFISYGELETEALIHQAEGLASIIKELDNQGIDLNIVEIESADHGKAFPMSTVKSLYWLEALINKK